MCLIKSCQNAMCLYCRLALSNFCSAHFGFLENIFYRNLLLWNNIFFGTCWRYLKITQRWRTSSSEMCEFCPLKYVKSISNSRTHICHFFFLLFLFVFFLLFFISKFAFWPCKMFFRSNILTRKYTLSALREERPYLKIFWSVFSHIRTEFGKMQTKKTSNTETFLAVQISRNRC